MTRKKDTPRPASPPPVTAEEVGRIAANFLTSHAAIIGTLAKPLFGETDLAAIYGVLKERAGSVQAGDLSSLEAMLTSQATTLNVLFLDLVRRSHLNLGEYLDPADRYMRLALKAQAQCRAAVETLAAMKSPPVVFAKQANIAAGPQQVNNGTSTRAGAPARAGSPESMPNELLETEHGKRLEPGTTGAAIGGDPALEALGAIDGTAVSGGESTGKPQPRQGRKTAGAQG